MRDIKFRAWDKEKKEWIDMSTLRFAIDGQTRVPDMPPSRYELLQYTGLKDKNGKDIYEGDIVRVLLNDEEIEKGDAQHMAGDLQVYWHRDEARFFLVDFVPFGWTGHKSFEVIGNIYENPELLAKPAGK